jgi:hypothetical protein
MLGFLPLKFGGGEFPMIILKLALLSSLFYIGIAFLLQAGIYVIAHAKGIVGISHNPLRLGGLFAIIWLISFSIAWLLLYSGR